MIRDLARLALLLAPALAALAAETAAPAKESAQALVEGQLPDDPARTLVQAKCLLCHSGEYVTMQRLTEKQWQATVEKMRKFGSPASDEEAKAMVAYLARYWTPDLPPLRPVLSPPPPGSAPRK
ncbi:MAG TPA: cytochrome c [Myxococcales bacterium]|nr:cytochrome c [Myxococcales bacterium]